MISARRVSAIAICLTAAFAFATLLPGTITLDRASGATPNRAGLVVRFDDGDVRRMCIAFEEASISGLELLKRSRFELRLEQYASGSAVCKIGAQGCNYPSEGCFCRYPTFWGYWTQRTGENWSFSSSGASARTVRDGDVDGWSWGPNGLPAPAALTFEDVCPPTAPAAQPRPGATPRRTGTAHQSGPGPESARGPNEQRDTGPTGVEGSGATDGPPQEPSPAPTPGSDEPSGRVAASPDQQRAIEQSTSPSASTIPYAGLAALAFAFLGSAGLAYFLVGRRR